MPDAHRTANATPGASNVIEFPTDHRSARRPRPTERGRSPITGDELLREAGEIALRHLGDNVHRLATNDPCRPEITARISRWMGA